MKTQITVWPDGETYIVSVEGADEVSTTLDVCDTRQEARDAALAMGRERGLPVVEQDDHGVASVISIS